MKTRSRKNLRWSTERVLAEIQQWKDKGEPLYANHVRLNFQELLAASIRYFGSWQVALNQAGISYVDVRKYRKWSKEVIVEEIRNLAANGFDLSFRSMALSQHNAMVYAAIRPKYFGNWRAALEAAGLASEEIYRYRSWDEEGILEEIRPPPDRRGPISARNRWMNPPINSSRPPVGALEIGVALSKKRESTTRTFAVAKGGPKKISSKAFSS